MWMVPLVLPTEQLEQLYVETLQEILSKELMSLVIKTLPLENYKYSF